MIELNKSNTTIGPKQTVSITLDQVSGCSLNTNGLPIKSLKVTQWMGPGTITAPWIGNLTVTGNKKASLAATFEAGLKLNSTSAKTPALGSASIPGTLGDGLWDIAGNVGKVTIGAAAGSQINVSGVITSFAVGSADSNTALEASRIGSLTSKGNFSGNLVLQGDSTSPALASASISGNVGAGTWNITGNVSSITVKGSATGLRVCTTGNIAKVALGSAVNCSFLAGFTSQFAGNHPATAADFDPGRLSSIGSIKITGFQVPKTQPIPRFVDNSCFSAAKLGTVQLTNVNLANCGLYAKNTGSADDIKSVTVSDTDPAHKGDPAYNWSWPVKNSTAIADLINLLS